MKKRVLLIVTLVLFLMGFVSATPYYVDATNGLDFNDGLSEGNAWQTIQKCLDTVVAGDNCMIRGGTYNEDLVLKTPGISSDRITIQNYNGEAVTVNSGDSKVLRAGGRMHYYTIEGLRFISNHVYYITNFDYTIDLRDGIWDGENNSGGNNGFIFRNCYVEGAIHLYGHNNLVENCELNGMNQWGNGIWEMYGSSYNVYRNNTVHGYQARGIWSMSNTHDITIEGNTVYDIPGLNGDCYGIDADGAGLPVKRMLIRNNRVYNIGGSSCGLGIGLENSFDSIVENNFVSGTQNGGISVISYGADITEDDQEYRDDFLNSTIRNNVIYDSQEAGILANGASGISVYSNTISNTIGAGAENWYAGILLFTYGGFPCTNWTIKNNVFYENSKHAIFLPAGVQGLVMDNNLYYDSGTQSIINTGWTNEYTLLQFQQTFGQESNSLFTDPLFIDPSVNDFHLQAGSPAIDAGADVGLTEDFDGNPIVGIPDIGAFEYQGLQSDCTSGADINPIDNVVSIGELLTYISSWKSGSVSIGNLLTAISEWKNGC